MLCCCSIVSAETSIQEGAYPVLSSLPSLKLEKPDIDDVFRDYKANASTIEFEAEPKVAFEPEPHLEVKIIQQLK